jgi:hypothetical protein
MTKLPVKVVSGKSKFAVPFATYTEAIAFIEEIGRTCPEVVYHIEFEEGKGGG